MDEFSLQPVAISSVPPAKANLPGKYARLLAYLIDLPSDKAVAMDIANIRSSWDICHRLSRLADKEGYTLQRSRNQDGTKLYLWLKKREK